MKPNRVKILMLGLLGLSLLLGQVQGSNSHCGFPGTPAFGFVKPEQDQYDARDIVTYSCRVGYILLGAPVRRCRENGSWTEEIPICDDSMTTLGFAISTAAVPGHPSELAIDRDKDTCTYLLPKKIRWWRIDLGKDYNILSVAVTIRDTDKFTKFTVFVIKMQGTSASYKICATFTGKFGTPTIVFTCADGKGIEGQRVHIEDQMKTEGIFEVCEVEVQVEKDAGYECGRPDRNPNSITFDVEGDQVEYGCLTGYELHGREFRQCLNNGQWTGEAPTCKAILCEPLPPLENGQLQLSVINEEDRLLEGTLANYNCDEGYKLLGNFNRLCLKNGSWSGKQPHCEAVRCPVPNGSELGGVYRLVNRTTRMGSMAMLKCKKGKMDGNNPFIICTEEGDWTEPQSRCTIPAPISARVQTPKIAKKEAIIFGMVVAGIMMTVVLVSLYVVMQRRRRARKPALPRRQVECPEAPPRPPPRTKGTIAATLLECVSGSAEEGLDEPDGEALLKTRSLPHKSVESWKSAPRAASMEDGLHDKPEEEKKSSSPSENKELSVDANAEVEKDKETNDATADSAHQDEEPKSSPNKTGKEYAAVDYEQKRQSRMQKVESADVETPRNEPADEDENGSPPIVPPKDMESASVEKPDTPKETRPASPESTAEGQKPQENTETAVESQTKAPDAAEPERGGPRRTRRTRAQVETPAEPEEKPLTRGLRRTRLRE